MRAVTATARKIEPEQEKPAVSEDKSPLLERLGVAYLRWRAAKTAPPEAEDEVHVLNAREQAKLRRVERGVVLRAGIAGALSALAAALAERWADGAFGAAPEAFTLSYYASYWGVVGGVTAVASVLEIAFLYQDSLEGVHRLSNAAGLALFDRESTSPIVASALARAALELPNPLETPYHIDPHREVSRPRLLLATIVYKLKIGITTFLIKVLLRRLLARAAVRVWLVFVGVPVTAIWNAIVAFRVIREARVRAMGPSAAHALVRQLILQHGKPSRAGGIAALRAVGACVVSSFDLHPNHHALLDEVREAVGDPGQADLGDRDALLSDLAKLSENEQRFVVGLLGVAAVLDARLTRRERALFSRAREAIGLTPTAEPLAEMRRAFARGRPLDDTLTRALTV
jgi:hypothetical protein